MITSVGPFVGDGGGEKKAAMRTWGGQRTWNAKQVPRTKEGWVKPRPQRGERQNTARTRCSTLVCPGFRQQSRNITLGIPHQRQNPIQLEGPVDDSRTKGLLLPLQVDLTDFSLHNGLGVIRDNSLA